MADKVIAQRIVELMAENHQLKRYLESLTPGGSEFYNDPKRCVEWVRERLSGVIEQVKKRKEAEEEIEHLKNIIACNDETIEEMLAEYAALEKQAFP